MQRLYRMIFIWMILFGVLNGCQSNENVKSIKQETAASPSTSSETKQQSNEKLKQEPSQALEPKAPKEAESSKQESIKTPGKEAVAANQPKSQAEPKQETPVKPPTAQNVPTSATATTTSTAKEQSPKKQTVSLSIKGDEQVGLILPSLEVEIEEGDTVLDVLKRATKQKGIQMEFSGSGSMAYVEGIDNLYEFDKGPKSGWMYKVNGGFAEKSAGDVALKPGDRIEWLYTLDLGKDLK